MAGAKKHPTPPKLAVIDCGCDCDDAVKAALPQLVLKLIARVEVLDRYVRHDLGEVLYEQREQRKTLEIIKDLLTDLLTKEPTP